MATICRLCIALQRHRSNILVASHGGKVYAPYTYGRELHSSPLNTNEPEESGGHEGYPLPWVQHSRPFAVREPFWNRVVGLFLMKRVANMHSHSFSSSEFLVGVRDAVYTIAEVMTDQDRYEQLEHLLEPSLYSALKLSLDSLPPNAHVHLDIESIRGLQLSCTNAIIGSADPGDEHVIAWLGQRVITSQSKLHSIMDQDTRFTFDKAREIGKDASFTRLEFQLGVSFNTKEKFAVLDENGKVVQGSNQFRDCYHFWKFSSLVAWETEDFPFSWTVADINNYIHSYSNIDPS